MKYVTRELEGTIKKAARSFPAIVLTGPRRAGKTHLLRHLFPNAGYFLLEDPDIVSRLRADPHGFLDDLTTPVILDEVQNVPDIFAHVRARIDREPRRVGQWILTGSQEAPLMRNVSESMAGRAAVLRLLPFSFTETSKVGLLHGGYPEVVARPNVADLWFSSFLQTYLERDVRALISVRDLATFRRFIALLASRHGQMLNKTDIAAPLGVSVPTITQWLGVLETTAQVLIIPPYFENMGKRLVKTPKVYIADAGLACHLLGINSSVALNRSTFHGAIFEGFIAAEIVKSQVHQGARQELYYFRDHQGLEVDFLLPARDGALKLIECKSTRTPLPAMASRMIHLAQVAAKRSRKRVEMRLVHQPAKATSPTHALAPDVRAMAWPEFLNSL